MVGKPPAVGGDKSSRRLLRSVWLRAKRMRPTWKATDAILSQLRSILVNGGIIVALGFIAFAIVSELSQNRTIIEPLLVPKEFEERGMSGEVIARQLTEEIRAIASSSYPKSNYVVPTLLKSTLTRAVEASSLLNPVLPGNVFSLQTFVRTVREVSRRPEHRVRAEMVIVDACSASNERGSDVGKTRPHNAYSMRLHEDPEQASWEGCDADANALAKEAAAQIMRARNPFGLGMYYYNKKDMNSARREFERIVSKHIRGDEQWALNMLGNIAEDKRDHEGAIKYFKQIVAMNSEPDGFPFKYAYYSWGYILQEQHLYDPAIEQYQKAIEADPKFAPSYSAWGKALKHKGDVRGAIDKYQMAVKFDPKWRSAWNGWGNALSNCGQYAQAIEKFKKAIDIDPTYSDPHFGLGFTLGGQGDLKGARKEFQQALDLDAKSADAYAGLGAVDFCEGKRDEAVSNVRKAVDLESDNEYAKQQLHNITTGKCDIVGAPAHLSCPP